MPHLGIPPCPFAETLLLKIPRTSFMKEGAGRKGAGHAAVWRLDVFLTSTVLPLAEVKMSPGLIPLPDIMFSQLAVMIWIYSQ